MFYWNDISVKTDTGKYQILLYKQMKHIGNITFVLTVYVEVNSEFSQIFKTDIFAKIVKGFKLSNICARTSS